MTEYLLMFEDCRIVRGYLNNIIYDLHRTYNSNFIPDEMVEFIEKCKQRNLSNVFNEYSIDEQIIIQEYITFLLDREFAFLADKHMFEQMGSLSLEYNTPAIIHNAIICIDSNTTTTKIFEQLNNLLCENLELRIKQINKTHFNDIISKLMDSTIEVIIIHAEFVNYYSVGFFKNHFEKNPRLKQVFVYDAPFNNDFGNIQFYKNNINFNEDCGYIEKEDFTINQPFFLESQSCNTCLHKKLSVDFDGSIKSCPSSKKSFGLVDESSLENIISQDAFTKLWYVKKDDIEVCKDCEYRHMCMDCRVFIDEVNNIYSRPSKCNYNPYIAKWKGEEGYRTLAECGVKSDETGFSIDHERIAKINKELWGED